MYSEAAATCVECTFTEHRIHTLLCLLIDTGIRIDEALTATAEIQSRYRETTPVLLADRQLSNGLHNLTDQECVDVARRVSSILLRLLVD